MSKFKCQFNAKGPTFAKAHHWAGPPRRPAAGRQNPKTVQGALRMGAEELDTLSDSPNLDAEWLLLKVLQRDESSWLYTHGEEELSPDARIEFGELVERRATGEPLAYILGEWEFYGRSFYVNEDVLVPRPSTERLVESALKHVKSLVVPHGIERPIRPYAIADVGTGSGCIIISLALELTKEGINYYATDISQAALETAKRNAKRHGVEDKITFLQGDMLEPLKDKRVDLIVSNPPYVPSNEIAEVLDADVGAEKKGLSFEPILALDGGKDGNKYVVQLMEAKAPVLCESKGGKAVMKL